MGTSSSPPVPPLPYQVSTFYSIPATRSSTFALKIPLDRELSTSQGRSSHCGIALIVRRPLNTTFSFPGSLTQNIFKAKSTWQSFRKLNHKYFAPRFSGQIPLIWSIIP